MAVAAVYLCVSVCLCKRSALRHRSWKQTPFALCEAQRVLSASQGRVGKFRKLSRSDSHTLRWILDTLDGVDRSLNTARDDPVPAKDDPVPGLRTPPSRAASERSVLPRPCAEPSEPITERLTRLSKVRLARFRCCQIVSAGTG